MCCGRLSYIDKPAAWTSLDGPLWSVETTFNSSLPIDLISDLPAGSQTGIEQILKLIDVSYAHYDRRDTGLI